MGILERLKPQPRWKHSDPAVRAAAVYELGSNDADVLVAMAREDAEARVRRVAVTRIGDAAVLGEIAASDPEDDVRAEAVRGLAGIAMETADHIQAAAAVAQLLGLGRSKEAALVARDGVTPEVRAAAVDLIKDSKSLGSIARHARDAATRLLALARLADGEDLLAVALKAETADAAVGALERLSDRDAIAAVAQRARSKVAARRARARLRQLDEAVAVVAAADTAAPMAPASRASVLDLLHRIEGLLTVADGAAAASSLAELRLAWAELQADVEVDADLVRQVEAASDGVREAVAERQREQAVEHERAAALAAEQADRVAICELIETLDGPEAADRLAEAKVRWDALPPMPSDYAASLTRRFQDGLRAYEDRERRRQLASAAAGRLETLAADLEQLLASAGPLDDVVTRWRTLRRDADVLREHAPANPAAGERLERAIAALEAREEQFQQERAQKEHANLKRLQQLVRQVESLAVAESLSLKAGERAMTDIRAALEERLSLPSKKDRQEVQGRLEAARLLLAPRVQELREADEWQRWANLQVQGELCREMEALKTEENLDTASRKMRELQSRWKQVALAPRAQGETMWRRFKAAQDDVYARTAAHLSARQGERTANLSAKQALIEQAEAMADSRDWVKTAAAIQALQAQWKAIGPVPAGHEKGVWERFRGACDRFFTRRHEDLKRRKDEWSANLAKKEDLCARAEELADSTDWDAASGEFKRMQAEWKSVGPVRKAKSDAVWRRFRAACDRFFDRYKHRDQVELQVKAQPRETVLRDLEAQLAADGEAPAPEGLAAFVQAARVRWQEAPELPRQVQQDLAARYYDALGRLVARWPAAFAGSDLDPGATRARMEKLIARVEGLLSAQPSRPSATLSPTELLAQQLRERLASNTMTGGRAAESEESRWRTAEQEVRSAQAQWMRLGPVPPDVAGPLNERFQRACRRFYDQRRRAS